MAALKFFFSLLMIPVTLLVTAAGIIAFLANWVNPNESYLFTLAGLAMPVILLTNLLFLIYWAIGKRGWLFFPAGAILLNTGYLLSVFQITLTSLTPSPEQTKIRIATYNVGKFKTWQEQYTQYSVTNYFRNTEADIVCLQEFWDDPYLPADSLGHLMHLPYCAVEYLPGSHDLGSAIFSRFPILRSGRFPFENTTNDAMWADLWIKGQTVRIISCHLQTTDFSSKRKALRSSELQNSNFSQLQSLASTITSDMKKNSRIRAAQADIIRQMLDTLSIPVIVCGDFNDPPSSYTYQRIKGPLKDSFRSRGNGYGYTFRNLHRLLRIDYILYSEPFLCTVYHSSDQEWSDHNPIICELYL